ncbi:MAG: hypothetical protein ACYC4L_09855 [Chloroflexota bacterium]
MFSITLSARGLRAFYVALGVANTLLLGAFALIQAERLRPGLVAIRELDPAHQLSLQQENGIFAVWYSSALFLLVAIAAAVNYWSDGSSRTQGRERWPVVRQGWLLLAAVALFLSADEIAQFHEGIGTLASGPGGLPALGLSEGMPQFAFAWVIVFAPLLVGSALLLFAFFIYWLAAAPRARLLAALGIVCWAMVPVMEIVESRLARTFGAPGTLDSQFCEESLETVGTTLLLIAALEYFVARGVPEQAPGVAPARSGRLAVAWGVAAPLLLIPLAGLALTVDLELRERVVHAGYRYAAARVMLVMDRQDPGGNHLLLSDGCGVDTLRGYFPYEVRQAGSLEEYPPAGQRTTSPDRVLTALDLASGGSPGRTEEGLARVASLSTHLWYLQCGDTSQSERGVEDWLARQSSPVDRSWLPGLPPLTLLHVAPALALANGEGEAEPAAAFGDGSIALVAYDWHVDEQADERVLRLRLLWQTQEAVTTDYHVFVHLLDGEGNLAAQSDGVPVYDRYPFSSWTPGELVADSYDVPLPAGVPLAEAEVRLGLYDYETRERLAVGDADHLTLTWPGTQSAP